MQEMYYWYMDNLFPEHRIQAIKHAEKDGRDRKKRIAKGGAGRKAVSVSGMAEQEMRDYGYRMMTRSYDGDYSGRSKWERIGPPFVASVVDWGLIIEPTGWADPNRRRVKLLAIQRQYDRYKEAERRANNEN